MSVFYLDTSAALKLLAEESHSVAFASFFDDHQSDSWVSSRLLRVELMRSVTRVRPAARAAARELLDTFTYISIDDEIIESAMAEPELKLRSLDAIHLATARALQSDLEGLVTYDDRLSVAAQRAGMTVVSPRDK